jgi:hypothetical protein
LDPQIEGRSTVDSDAGASHARSAMSAVRAMSIGRERLAAVEALQGSVDAFLREFEAHGQAPLTGGEWGPREVLCHLVYWHETYVSILHAMNLHEEPMLKEGVFREFNRLAVEELGHVPADVLVSRLETAQRRLGIELLRMSPSARIRIKSGQMARGPVEFTRRIEGHFLGHLADIRRMAREQVAG